MRVFRAYRTRIMIPMTFLIVLFLLVVMISPAWSQETARTDNQDEETQTESRSLLSYIQSGGIVGYTILLLSLAGVAMIVDGFINIREPKLIPQNFVTQVDGLVRQGKFPELLTLCKTHESIIAQILASGLDEAQLGGEAIRQAMQEKGTQQITRLHQRVGYIGLVATVAPMLGLLGTVTGMIRSFDTLGAFQGAARPDQLAIGVSEALVTTCMGLIVALPLMFFHSLFRDRITRVGQHASGICDRTLRLALAVSQIQQQNAANAKNSNAKAQATTA